MALAFFKTDLGKLDDESAGGSTSLTPKDFFWDRMVTVLVSVILGLTLLDVVAEFFRSTGLQCYTPYNVEIPHTNDFTRDRAAFVNGYCHRYLPRGEFFTVFLLLQGIGIITPHLFWSSLFSGKLEHFFGFVGELNRLRDLTTGQYDAKNFEIVRKLEKDYGRRIIFIGYEAKLCVQLLFSLTSLVFGLFYFTSNTFLSTFCCPNGCGDTNATLPLEWPLKNISLYCVYPLPYHLVLRNLDVALLSVATVLLMYGLLWCNLRHSTELGHDIIAKFVNKSCLTADDYVTKSWLHQLSRLQLSPRINNDVQFLLTKVFNTNAGFGKVFKDIQIQREINQLNREMSELLQMFVVSEGVGHHLSGKLHAVYS